MLSRPFDVFNVYTRCFNIFRYTSTPPQPQLRLSTLDWIRAVHGIYCIANWWILFISLFSFNVSWTMIYNSDGGSTPFQFVSTTWLLASIRFFFLNTHIYRYIIWVVKNENIDFYLIWLHYIRRHPNKSWYIEITTSKTKMNGFRDWFWCLVHWHSKIYFSFVCFLVEDASSTT